MAPTLIKVRGFGGAGLKQHRIQRMENFDKLKTVVASIEADVVKFEKGNDAAGTRIRKGMQELKEIAQTIRTEVTEIKHKTAG